MSRLRVMTIIGTRPEIIRLSECIKACDRHFDHILVHTGQNYDYELNEVFFKDLGLRVPDHYLNCAGVHLGETIGNVIARSYEQMQNERPDALLILGDTNSALCAIAAKRLKIPVFHMEAGNRCYDQNVPEEINRKIVDHTSDINLPYTEHGRRNLLAEGLHPQFVFVTGSPMREVLEKNKKQIESSAVMDMLGLKKDGYIVLSAHREENVDHEGHFYSLMEAVNTVAKTYGLPVVFSTHPRSKKRIVERGLAFHPLVKSLPPFGFHDYVRLQMNARCVLSDSGTLSEESAILGFPGVLIRTNTERPEAVDKGTVVVGGITKEDVLGAIELAVSMRQGDCGSLDVSDYRDDNVSDKIVRLIHGYTGIVNSVVWRK